MRSREDTRRTESPKNDDRVDTGEELCGPPSMAVSIAGISTACSKNALVSSAKAAREALSSE